MQERFSSHKFSTAKNKVLSSKWRIVASCLLGIALIFFGLNTYKQRSENKVFRTLITSSYSGDVVAFSADGKMMGSGHKANPAILRIWSLETDRLVYTIETNQNGGIGLISFSPNSKLIATCDAHDGERVFMWDAKTGEKLNQLVGSLGIIDSLFYSQDGQFLITAGYEGGGYGSAEIWDVKTGRRLYKLQRSEGNVFAAPMPEGRTFLTTNRNATQIYDLKTGQVLRAVPISQSPREYLKAALSLDGKTLALCTRLTQGAEETTELWDVTTGQLRHSWQENAGNKKGPLRAAVQSLTFSPNNQLLVSASKGEPVKLRDVQTGVLHNSLKLEAQSLAFSPDGKTLAIGTQREVRLYKVDDLLGRNNS